MRDSPEGREIRKPVVALVMGDVSTTQGRNLSSLTHVDTSFQRAEKWENKM